MVKKSHKDITKLGSTEAVKQIRGLLAAHEQKMKDAAAAADSEEANVDSDAPEETKEQEPKTAAVVRQAQVDLQQLVTTASPEQQDAIEGAAKQNARYIAKQTEDAKAKLGSLTDEQLLVRLKSLLVAHSQLVNLSKPEVMQKALHEAAANLALVRTEQQRRRDEEHKPKEEEQPRAPSSGSEEPAEVPILDPAEDADTSSAE